MTELYTILSKYISGEASPEEAATVDDWINASPENKKEFSNLFNIMEAAVSTGNYRLPDTAAEWNAFLNTTKTLTKPKWQHTAIYGGTILIIITAILIFFFARNKQERANQITISSNLATLDTSIGCCNVYLDKEGTISFPEKSSATTIISITGGAFFNTKNNEGSYGGVFTDGETKIIPQGEASFYVLYDSVKNNTAIHVQSGNIVVKQKQAERKLAAKDALQINNGEMKKIPVNANLYSYATKIFDFVNTALPQALSDIEKAYGVTINVSSAKLDSCRITALFDNKPLPEILDIMSFTLNFEYVFTDNNKAIIISGKGCK